MESNGESVWDPWGQLRNLLYTGVSALVLYVISEVIILSGIVPYADLFRATIENIYTLIYVSSTDTTIPWIVMVGTFLYALHVFTKMLSDFIEKFKKYVKEYDLSIIYGAKTFFAKTEVLTLSFVILVVAFHFLIFSYAQLNAFSVGTHITKSTHVIRPHVADSTYHSIRAQMIGAEEISDIDSVEARLQRIAEREGIELPLED